EVVYEREVRLAILQRILEALLRNPGRLVLVTRGLASAADALWLEMEVATHIVAIDRERNQRVERPAKVYDLPGTARSTGNENSQTDIRLIVDLYRRVGRDDQNRQHGNETHRHPPNTSFHEVFLRRAIVGWWLVVCCYELEVPRACMGNVGRALCSVND